MMYLLVAGLVLQNDVTDPPGYFADWADARGLEFELRMAEFDVPADPTRFDWLLLSGSRASAADARTVWIAAELELIRAAEAEGVPILGICFGAQALSVALGGEISPAFGGPGSAGWLTTISRREALVSRGPWVYLNSERFSVPPRAELIAESARGPAAFALGPHLGVQFHPEGSPSMVVGWGEDLDGRLLADAEMTIDDLRAQGREHGPGARERAFALFDAWRALA